MPLEISFMQDNYIVYSMLVVAQCFYVFFLLKIKTTISVGNKYNKHNILGEYTEKLRRMHQASLFGCKKLIYFDS